MITDYEALTRRHQAEQGERRMFNLQVIQSLGEAMQRSGATEVYFSSSHGSEEMEIRLTKSELEE